MKPSDRPSERVTFRSGLIAFGAMTWTQRSGRLASTCPDADLADMKRRLAATRWPDKETVADQSEGAQLAKLQGLVRY